MICSICKERAVFSRRSKGLFLCREHFIQDFDRRVRQSLEADGISSGVKRIAVALSGGKDSTALLFSLHKAIAERDVELVAVTIDEGIAGYRDDTIRASIDIAGRLGVRQHIFSFRDEYGYSLDEMVAGKRQAPCTFCGVFRKSALNRAAKLLGADRVATGHNLDDEAQSIMMNYLKGDLDRLMRLRPRHIREGLVFRIKPLSGIAEKEIALYCMLNGIFVLSRECPYADLSFRADVRDMMNSLESSFPGCKGSTVQGFQRLLEASEKRPEMQLSNCNRCGEPCVRERCKACELLEEITVQAIH